MSRKGQVLLIDDDELFLKSYQEKLSQFGYVVTACSSIQRALDQMKQSSFDVLICDVCMPYNGNLEGGIELARLCRDLYPASKIIFISEYVTVKLVNQFIGQKNTLFVSKSDRLLEELLGMISEILNQHYIFVIMPFDSKFNDLYELGIKSAIIELGFTCTRVDELEFNSPILDKIIESIRRASFVVADLTGRSPNVYYELGYAHCLKKEVILLCKEIDEVPFDLRGFNVIIYGESIAKLKKELTSRIVAVSNT